MNPMSIMAQAEKLGIPQLQRSIQDGTVPAFIGIPLLQEKVKRAKQMQMGMAAQQPKRPSVAEQINQEADQTSMYDMMLQRAAIMQGQMAGTGGISDMLRKPEPEAMAKGGEVKHFYRGGPVTMQSIALKQANGEKLTPEEEAFAAKNMKLLTSDQVPEPTGMRTPNYIPPKTVVAQVTQPTQPQQLTSPITRAQPYMQDIWQAAGDKGIDPNVLMAVIDKESTFNPTAKNPKPGSTSAGMGGFTDAAAKQYGITDRTDPTQNINATASYLADNLAKVREAHPNMSPDEQTALAATMFNQGPNTAYNKLQSNIGYGNDILTRASAFAQNKDVDPNALKGMSYGNYAQAQPTGVPEQSSGIPTLVSTQAPQLSDIYSGMEIGKGSTPEEERAAYEKYMGPNKGLESLRGEISKMKDEAAAEKEKSFWRNVMLGGVETMAGPSQFAAVNIGKGFSKALNSYAEDMKDFRKERDRLVELQAKADDAQRAEDRAIYTHGEQSSAAKNAIRRSDLADQRRGKQETAYQNAQLDLSNRTKDITAYGTQLEAAKLGLSDQAQEQQFMQANAILNNPKATPEQKAQAQSVYNGFIEMNKAKSPYSALKQTSSMLETAQDNYNKYYEDLLKNDSTAKPIPFSEWLTQRYTPSQIKAMTEGETIGASTYGAQSGNVIRYDSKGNRI